MSQEIAEIPTEDRKGRESLPDITPENRGLYLLLLWFLGLALIGGTAGWIAMVLLDKTVPEGLPLLIATIVGGFVGAISRSEKAK